MFGEQMRKFTHSNYFTNHYSLESGHANAEQLRISCNVQTLFFNFHTHASNEELQVEG